MPGAGPVSSQNRRQQTLNCSSWFPSESGHPRSVAVFRLGDRRGSLLYARDGSGNF
jgi:hypothetical protein